MKKLIFTFALAIFLMPSIVKAESTRFLLYSTTSGCNVNGSNRCSTYEFYNYSSSGSNMDFFRITGTSPLTRFQDVFNLKFEKPWDTSKSYSLVFNLYSNELDRLQDVTVNSMACIFSSPKYEDYHDGDYPYRSYITSVYCPIVAGKQGNDDMFQVRAWFTSSDTAGSHQFGVSYHVAYEELDSSSNQDILDSIQSSQDKIIDNQDKNHQDTMDTITNGSVDSDGISSLGGTELPNNGALSAILNLPVSFFNTLAERLSPGSFSCKKVIATIPFVNQEFSLPCLNTLIRAMGLYDWWQSIGYLAGGVTLFFYLLYLGKQFDKMSKLKETNGEFGGL